MRLVALAAVVVGCGGGEAGPDALDPDAEVCAVSDGTAVAFDLDEPACTTLSSYKFFVGAGDTLAPNDGVEPYDLNTALFSDYALKQRFVWLPDGQSMAYHATDSFAVPVGAVILKTFEYPDDLRAPDGSRRRLETRMMVHRAGGWDGVSYVWNDEQTDAQIKVAGAVVPVTWTHLDGEVRTLDYVVPNKNQCKQCHEETVDAMGPIGPKARHVNRDFAYPGGTDNQLVHLTGLGYLTGAPADPADAPRAPVFDDESTGTVEERARAWLDINCAHCHNPAGAARTSGLDLRAAQTNPYEFGVCKTPVAAGAGSGGRQYNIVPGDPDQSILVYRIESVDPAVRMPEIGRKLQHTEGVALIRQWITEMTGEPCTPPA
ncbi:MAG TPA: SO2930 family diheme c-type cytochrome [Kofleriaceae bacterium]|nr:SO2930 family diheme c-type cytochrome [Kofleriaceae bacterium]